jgi:hypothetical protein
VLAEDNRYVVEELGLTHQNLAKHLHVMGGIASWQLQQHEDGEEFLYRGRRFEVELFSFRGSQESPFRDGTKTSSDATVHNLDNRKMLTYSLLVPHMIERYGFYEGKGTLSGRATHGARRARFPQDKIQERDPRFPTLTRTAVPYKATAARRSNASAIFLLFLELPLWHVACKIVLACSYRTSPTIPGRT